MYDLIKWCYCGDNVKFYYSNGKVLTIDKVRFNRAFGSMIQLDYETMKKEYNL